MAHRSDPRFLVLHGLRIKSFAEVDAVAGAVSLPADDARAELAAAHQEGLVSRRDGRVSGWSLTGEGRRVHTKLLGDDLAVAGCRAEMEGEYRRFLAVNPGLLEACTSWQLRSLDGRPVPNDHGDSDYDAEVVGRIHAIHDTIGEVTAALAGLMERFSSYGPRLSSALTRVDAGEGEWLTKPMIDSYHTVWFELHEDLLVTLGLERSAEPR